VGKSLCAEAFAATLWPRVNFIRVKTPLLLSKYFGGSEESIRQLFRLARQLTPALVFLDELDAISASRGLDEGDASSGLNERIVATLLNELDGIGHQDAAEATVFLVACTNRLAAVDPALLRPGRFGTHIHVGLPNPAQRLDILRTLAQSIAFDPTPECLDLLGPRTAGFTGADLALLCQEAALLALADDPDVARIPLSCFQRALGGFASQSQSQAL
jgi:SpoVK/Ycf46/Vps4 family AAA+-type ATPase